MTGRRVVATIIDSLVLGAAYWLLGLAFGHLRTEGEAANWVANLPTMADVTYGLLVLGYYLLLEGLGGQTLGKLAVGIKVIAEATGQAPGIAAAAVRTLLRIVDGLLGAAWFAHQALHRRAVTIPTGLLGIGVLGVGVFPGNVHPQHPLFAFTAFVAGGLAVLLSATVTPRRYGPSSRSWARSPWRSP